MFTDSGGRTSVNKEKHKGKMGAPHSILKYKNNGNRYCIKTFRL